MGLPVPKIYGTNQGKVDHSHNTTFELFLIPDFKQIWQLPNCKIIIFVDVYEDLKQNYEIQ